MTNIKAINQLENQSNRIQSVDCIRLIAIVAVIAIHTTPFSAEDAQSSLHLYLGILIDQLSRFAVPFFFVVSGFFWGAKLRKGGDASKTTISMAKRLFVIFMFWSLIYLVPYNLSAIYEHGIFGPLKVSYWNVLGLLDNPSFIFFQGTKVHLWFIIALIFSLFITYIFIKQQQIKALFIVSLVLYVTGVLLNSYSDSNIGTDINFNTRNGPFFGTLFFVSGYLLSQFRPAEKWFFYGICLFSFGFALQFTEILLLNKFFGTKMLHDYVFGTYFMGVGVAMLSLSNHKSLHFKGISKIGSMTLGVYAVHYIFVDLLVLVDKNLNSFWWEISYVFIVLGLSIAVTLILAKSSFFKRVMV